MSKIENSRPSKSQPHQSQDADHFFLNPYNFVATPSRTKSKKLPGVAGDSTPNLHGRNAKDTISGWVDVKLTAVSPLLLTDFSLVPKESQRNGRNQEKRRVQTVRTVGGSSAPELLATSFKGAIRSAYEAITNSRFGTLDERHQYKCTERVIPNSDELKKLFPGIITGNDAGDGLAVKVLEGVNKSNLKCDAKVAISAEPPGFDPVGKPELYYASVKKKKEKTRVVEIHKAPDDGRVRFSESAAENTIVAGYFHWTEGKFGTEGGSEGGEKIYEHFFITDLLKKVGDHYEVVPGGISTKSVEVTELVEKWDGLISSYVDVHKNDISKSGLATYITHPELWKLEPGRTVWVQMDGEKVTALSPSMIGRKVFDSSPRELIESSHHLPASCPGEFSAADRVFGWVGDNTNENNTVNAHRGSLTFSPPKCLSGSQSIVHFSQAFPLAILSSAHSSQWRFYASDQYKPKTSIRGRKFFIPHRLATDTPGYWLSEENTKPNPGHTQKGIGKAEHKCFREYISPEEPEADDKVHTWIDSWVKPKTEFTVRVRLDNVRNEDASALLWLLDLSNHRLDGSNLEPQIGIGFGKPLGFGSMTMVIEASCLYDNTDIDKRYCSLRHAIQGVGSSQGSVKHGDLARNFDSIPPEDSSRLHATKLDFLLVSTGWEDIPVHYPRESAKPVQEGYEWFTENKKADNPQVLPEPKKNSAPILKTHK